MPRISPASILPFTPTTRRRRDRRHGPLVEPMEGRVLQSGDAARAAALAVPAVAPIPSVDNVTVLTTPDGRRRADLTITLAGTPGRHMTLRVRTANGTAEAGRDYTAVNRVVRVAAGRSTAVISVPIEATDPAAPNRSFRVIVTDGPGKKAPRALGTVTIDNDAAEEYRPTLKPIGTVKDLTDWTSFEKVPSPSSPDPNVAAVPLQARLPHAGPSSIVGFDLAEDEPGKYDGWQYDPYSTKWSQGGIGKSRDGFRSAANIYDFAFWQYLDISYYFGHKLVTLPPTMWTDAAHANGVESLGTLDLNRPDAAAILASLTPNGLANTLGQIATYYGFDGFLVNYEPGEIARKYGKVPEIGGDDMLSLLSGMRSLGMTVVWYDSQLSASINPKTKEMGRSYANYLNAAAVEYLEAAGDFQTNYSWGPYTESPDLKLVHWEDGTDVPTEGAGLAVAGLDDDGLLQIRTFDVAGVRTDISEEEDDGGALHLTITDASGNVLSDEPESSLPADRLEAIEALKKQLRDWVGRELSDEEYEKVLEELTKICGSDDPWGQITPEMSYQTLEDQDPGQAASLRDHVYSALDPYRQDPWKYGSQFFDALHSVISAEAPDGYDTGVGIFAPNWTYYDGKNPGEEQRGALKAQERDQAFWTGTGPEVPQYPGFTSQDSIAGTVDARSVIASAPFSTDFNTGEGSFYDVQGVRAATGPWSDLTVQSILPTYRFTKSPGSNAAVTAELDYTDAYNGGSSLSLRASELRRGASASYNLFATAIPASSVSRITYTVKALGRTRRPRISATVAAGPSGTVSLPGTVTARQKGWLTMSFPIPSRLAGATIGGIGLTVAGRSARSARLDLAVGQMQVLSTTAPARPALISEAPAPVLDWSSDYDPSSSYRIYGVLGGRYYLIGVTRGSSYATQGIIMNRAVNGFTGYLVQEVNASGASSPLPGPLASGRATRVE